MPKRYTPSEKVAQSLAALQALQRQKRGQRVFESKELTRADREQLLRSGFLRRIMKGWLFSSSPSAGEDDKRWHTCFWEFCGRYCNARFGKEWHFSAEQSLLLLAENRGVPDQVVVCTPKGTNNTLLLPFNTSLYDLKQADLPPTSDVVMRAGLRLYSRAAALVRVSESFYLNYPTEIQVALEACEDAEILGRLLEEGRSHVAGRLAGAFRRANRPQLADKILAIMKKAGYDVRERDPFAVEQEPQALSPESNLEMPPVGRIQSLWNSVRTLKVFQRRKE